MKLLRKILSCAALAAILSVGSDFIESRFLGVFLRENIIMLLITLMAINTATSSMLISKMGDLAKGDTKAAKPFYDEIKMSLVEQVVLIAVAVVVLVIDGSPRFSELEHGTITVDIVLATIFVFALDVLWDTGKAIFLLTGAGDND